MVVNQIKSMKYSLNGQDSVAKPAYRDDRDGQREIKRHYFFVIHKNIVY